MMTVDTELRVSVIDGIGVFATEFIPAGKVVWKLDERFYSMIHKDEIDGLPTVMKEHFKKYGWPHMKRKGTIVCDIDNGRFMNHSGDANTDFHDAELAWATRDIMPGEEITCNYSEFIPEFRGF